MDGGRADRWHYGSKQMALWKQTYDSFYIHLLQKAIRTEAGQTDGIMETDLWLFFHLFQKATGTEAVQTNDGMDGEGAEEWVSSNLSRSQLCVPKFVSSYWSSSVIIFIFFHLSSYLIIPYYSLLLHHHLIIFRSTFYGNPLIAHSDKWSSCLQLT